jgi:isoquinoline 1-oxidoreductase beta subunit
MDAAPATSRRQFLKGSAAVGLVIAFDLPITRLAAAAASEEFAPNAFLRIAPDNTVTAISKHIEFGQGAYTGIATVLANELDAEWSQIRVESAPADLRRYVNLAYRTVQGTGGSNAMANSWDQLRQAGAQARALLVAAAAKQWKVTPDSITIERGVLKGAAGQSATFGEVATLAQSLTIEGPFKPKNPADWRLIGTHLPKVDTIPKTNGTAKYTIDISLPDLATCLIARPTRFGASVKEFDASAALAIPGVKEAFVVPEGVAVLADGFWSAKKGRDALRVTWDETGTEARGSKEIISQYIDAAQTEGARARNEGDVTNALSQASKTIEATYIFPYLAHAPLEPNDCVIRRTDDGGVELMLGSQMPSIDQEVAADVMGLSIDKVKIKTLLAGGSFGRRGTPRGDMAIEAANVLKSAKHGGPIKVMWTREDDIRGARYRPLFVERVRGGLDADGNVIAWDHVLVGQSFVKGTRFEASMLKEGFDERMVNGASSLPYAIPNLRISSHVGEVGISTLWWRSVASNHTGYSTETFVDLLADAANTDPVAFRQKLLSKQPRHLRVLNLAAEKAGWGGPLGDGRARGVAVHQSFKTYVAYVVEVSVGEDKLPKVERVVAAVDCGIAINPDIVTAQIEGGMGFGLSAALYGSIDIEDGRVKQSNFNDYRVLRINEMPPIEVYIVPSTEEPTGIGEPGVPPIGPAVANAWAKLTGQRVFELPFSRSVGRAT